MKQQTIIKRSNSKGQLAKACIQYQRALSHYANESNWAVRGDDIIWLGDDDPTYAAQLTLGQRKFDPQYKQNKIVREPDRKDASNGTETSGQSTASPVHEGLDQADAGTPESPLREEQDRPHTDNG